MEVVPGVHWVDAIWDVKVYVLIDGDRVVLVDAAMPGRADVVWRYLASLGYGPQAVGEIWLTHGDIDHMGSVAALKAASGARVVAHCQDVPLVEGTAERPLGPLPRARFMAPLSAFFVHRILRYEATVVDRPVQDGDQLDGWQVVHVPGHTAGSICFYHARRKIAIVGDALNHRRGRLGAPPPLFTPDMAAAYRSIQRIAALDFEVCCFGHGAPLTEHARERVEAFARTLPGSD